MAPYPYHSTPYPRQNYTLHASLRIPGLHVYFPAYYDHDWRDFVYQIVKMCLRVRSVCHEEYSGYDPSSVYVPAAARVHQ